MSVLYFINPRFRFKCFTAERVTVYKESRLVYSLKYGSEITVMLLERYKIRHFCLIGAEDGGFIVLTRKKTLKTIKTKIVVSG